MAEGIRMKITKLIGSEIYDSRGWPTVQCDIELDHTQWVSASVPSGTSRGVHEAVEIRDGGKRLWGRGVVKAVENIEYIIAPALMGKEPDIKLDAILRELDGTRDKSHLGANTLLAVSIAMSRAQALQEGLELYELIAHYLGIESISIPFPQINMISGGAHANTKLPVQECIIVPVGMHNFRSAMEFSVGMFHELKALLERYNRGTGISDEGAFIADVTLEEALLCLCEIMQRASTDGEHRAVLALDIAASQLFDQETSLYVMGSQRYTTKELVAWYQQLVDTFPIYSLEDPFAEDDWAGWSMLMDALGDQIQIVADDLCVTQTDRIGRGIAEKCMNSVIIKPNQVGTISEALDAIKLCRAHQINTIVSHRSGETNDSFIADFAVGSNSGQIKAGGCCRGERLAKYNRLLAIEDSLLWDLLNS